MTVSHGNLVSQAQVIRLERQAWQNTPARVGKLLEDLADSAVLIGATREVWVDPVDGSDANAGTDAAPFQTFAKARREIGDVIPHNTRVVVHLRAHSDATGYAEEEFWDTPRILGVLEYVGHGQEEHQAAIALTAVTGVSDRVYDFSGASPDWTPGEHSGKDLEGVTFAGDQAVGQKRTILWNDEDHIYLSKDHNGSSYAPPSAGDTFRIVSPAVKINVQDKEAPYADYDFTRHWRGGEGNAISHGEWRPREGTLRVENIEMRHPDGDSTEVYASGAFDSHGVHVTSATTSRVTWHFNHATLRAGMWEGTADDMKNGWGISGWSRTNQDRPNLQLEQTIADITVACGSLRILSGSSVILRQSCLDARHQGSSWPYAPLYVEQSYFTTESNSEENMFLYPTSSSLYAIQVEQGARVDWFTSAQILADCFFCRVRFSGFMWLARDCSPAAGVSNPGLRAQYGGAIRIDGHNGSNFGDAELGYGTDNRITRAAANWDVDDSALDVVYAEIDAAADLSELKTALRRLTSHDGSQIYRPS